MANIPTTSKILTFTDDTTVLVRHTNPETAVTLLQEHTLQKQKDTFTLRKRKPPNIQLNGTHITQTRQVNTEYST